MFTLGVIIAVVCSCLICYSVVVRAAVLVGWYLGLVVLFMAW